jgi:hypothetical protein
VVDGFRRSVFNQETGHRWGVFAEEGPGAANPRMRLLLGRDDSHWSYFLHTDGSPLEGNAWQDNNDGTFSTATDITRFSYSPLDLYLMGLVPASSVAPWYVITNPQVQNQIDLFGNLLNPASPPQIIDAKTIGGTRSNFTIQELQTLLGPRAPPVGMAPTRWRAVFVMLADRPNPLTNSQKVEFGRMVDFYAAGFHEGTGRRGTLDYRIDTTGLLPIGARCNIAAECNPMEATLCSTPRLGGPTFCSRPCMSAASCPAGWCCGPDGRTGADVCQPSACEPPPPPPRDAGVIRDATPRDTGPPPLPKDSGVIIVPDASAPSDSGAIVTSGACACDVSFSCDPDCACDRECGFDEVGAGCGCQAQGSGGSAPCSALLLALVGARWWRRRS